MVYDPKQDWAEKHLTQRGWFPGAESNGRGHVTPASIPVGASTVRIERWYPATGQIDVKDLDARASEQLLARFGPSSFQPRR